MRRFFRRKQAMQAELPPPEPERLTYVVGDLHGRNDLLERALERIEQDRAGVASDLVFLGDFIDRGSESAEVLTRLATLEIPNVNAVCLMGNHERMMLDFLDDPDRAGERWLRNGGVETLSSFIPGRTAPAAGQSRSEALRDRFRKALGPDLELWVRSLPLQWKSGTLGCVHAMTDPAVSWEAQPAEILLWGRPTARQNPRFDGIWVAHGHTIVDEATAEQGHIALDTGAYRTGILTVLRCEPGAQEFMQIAATD